MAPIIHILSSFVHSILDKVQVIFFLRQALLDFETKAFKKMKYSPQ